MKTLPIIILLAVMALTGCSKDKAIPDDPGARDALINNDFFESVGSVGPINPNTYLASAMQACVYAATPSRSCKVAKLPLLGMMKNKITVQDILDRTLVSHQFLATAFKEVLLRIPAESLQMFGAVNAVVISDKINPSFYYSMTGAIYLSGRYFWSNLDEWNIVSQVTDYRDGAGNSLQYLFDHDYIKQGKSINARAARSVQSFDEMTPKAARVIYHELTHANDFFPSKLYSDMTVEADKTYHETASQHNDRREIVSLGLLPLNSYKLRRVASVLYFEAPIETQDLLTVADEVVNEFKNDTATDFYSYSNHFEDLAMLGEEALMLYFFNIRRYNVVVKLPSANFTPPENYVYDILWGEVSRVAEPIIKDRAFYAVENDLGATIARKVNNKLDNTVPKEIPAHMTWDEIYAL